MTCTPSKRSRPLQDFQSLMTFMKDVEATKKMDVRKRRLFRIPQSRGRPSWVQEVLAEMLLCNFLMKNSCRYVRNSQRIKIMS